MVLIRPERNDMMNRYTLADEKSRVDALLTVDDDVLLTEVGAVQVDPQLESGWFQPLNLKCDILVSNSTCTATLRGCCCACWGSCARTRTPSWVRDGTWVGTFHHVILHSKHQYAR